MAVWYLAQWVWSLIFGTMGVVSHTWYSWCGLFRMSRRVYSCISSLFLILHKFLSSLGVQILVLFTTWTFLLVNILINFLGHGINMSGMGNWLALSVQFPYCYTNPSHNCLHPYNTWYCCDSHSCCPIHALSSGPLPRCPGPPINWRSPPISCFNPICSNLANFYGVCVCVWCKM